MDQETRNKLQRATQQIRRLLEAEFADQLEGTFDILPSGKILPEAGRHLDARQRLTRQKLVDAIEHIKAGGKKPKEAVDEYTREAAFTFLNRFVALRMLEARELLQECVSKGDQSSGFKEFCGLAPGLASLPDGGYQLYLECLFDELSVEVKVLFDRRDSASLLWPRRTALNESLDILGQRELADIWSEDETIGWVYQYFNSGEERKKMREESQAPRNSRELAVRNQFFTPRYVVEFLTDNTLGRVWYEMRQGQTRLVDECHYLVRRPSEVFLSEGQEVPNNDRHGELSQEELLQKTVYIPHRAKKDPRDLKILDPACGSGHFLLYAFELLLTIYAEAYEDEELGPALKNDYTTVESFRHDVPRLILACNLHGIDIDHRATQIASLAIWMRAQRAYQQMNLSVSNRPRISKSNIVCAEPMPGEAHLLDEFVDQLEPRVLGQLVREVFDKMKLAGEAGSLLNIEEEIRNAVSSAHKQFGTGPVGVQQKLFGSNTQEVRQQRFDLSGISDGEFFEQAESLVLEALRQYAEQAQEEERHKRRLFSEDAARGFAFIDVCRKRYDVAVMNPPFGEPSIQSTAFLQSSFAETKADIDAAFVDRASALLLPDGLLGGIYNRTQFFKGYLIAWRDRNLLITRQLSACIDLGLGVLDGAMVEAAAYITSAALPNRPAVFISALSHVDKEQAVRVAYAGISKGTVGRESKIVFPSALLRMPGHRISYWVASRLLTAFDEHGALEGQFGYARQGLITADNDRFLRLIWEIPCEQVGRSTENVPRPETRGESYSQRWIPYAKGGDYAPFYGDIHLAVNWGDEGREICTFFRDGRLASRPQNVSFYFRRALTYTERTASDFSPRIMPDGCIFDCKGPIIAPAKDSSHLLGLLAISNSKVFKYFIELSLAGGDSSVSVGAARQFTQSIVGSVPIPEAFVDRNAELASIGKQIWRALAEKDATQETSRFFTTLKWAIRSKCLYEAVKHLTDEEDIRSLNILEQTERLEDTVSDIYRLDDDSRQEIAAVCGEHPNRFKGNAFLSLPLDEQQRLFETPVDEMIGELRTLGSVTRSITKMCYSADRWLEVAAVAYSTKPDLIIQQKRTFNAVKQSLLIERTGEVLSYIVGCAIGRWDIQLANGDKAAPDLPEPFVPLPICPPGLLQNTRGLPAFRIDVADKYPIKSIPWDGILVDDPNHPLDIESRVREVIEIIWKDNAGVIEDEVNEILGVRALRDYFRKSGSVGFWSEHIKRYSKSRRKAPIYWQLATPSCSYAVWLYYYRLTRDTIFKALNEYARPKLDYERNKLERLRGEFGEAPTRAQQKELEQQEGLESETANIVEEMARVAPLWNPNLNDGVIINFAPLWRLVPQNKAWQQECKSCWDKIVKGDYDWAHLAMHLWPERVVPKCVTDASLAVAHGLDEIFWEQDDHERCQPKKEPEQGWQPVIDRLVKERTSPAVKAALQSLLDAPTPSAGSQRSRGRARARA